MHSFVLCSLITTAILGFAPGCTKFKRELVKSFSPQYKVEGDGTRLKAEFSGKDESRKRLAVRLSKVAGGFTQITDMQFFPSGGYAVVLEKTGTAKWLSLADNRQGAWFRVNVLTDSEQGLLGLAFHPRFAENGRFFANYIVSKDGADVSRVAEFYVSPGNVTAPPKQTGLVMEVTQPYPNHNAGQLAFGPDGYLYIGWGDGGWLDDPQGNGQKMDTRLGKMLRVDVDRAEKGKGFAIPADNPFLAQPGVLPEIWASGLRNPWRYSFDSRGRLIVADVGQNLWEEVNLVRKGDNLGWKVREGRHCFEPAEGCPAAGFIEPVFEYGRDEGISITGGYTNEGSRIPDLRGKYVFGDFATGRMWAIEVPDEPKPVDAYTLGKWPVLISTFGRDTQGELYVADFGGGAVYRIDPE